MFDRFRQETGDITRTHSGLGIGLALVRHLTELHGGSVSAHSAGKGKGSVFCSGFRSFGSPRRRHDAPAADGSPARRSTLAGLHVLAVDDDADARDLMTTTLGQAGARVTTVASAAEAIASRRRRDPPRADRHRHAERQRVRSAAHGRGNPRTAGAPIVAITGRDQAADREHPLAAGFDGHIGKTVRARVPGRARGDAGRPHPLTGRSRPRTAGRAHCCQIGRCPEYGRAAGRCD